MLEKKTLLLIAFIEGAVMVLLELVVPHLTSPFIGNSVFVWGVTISIAVGGLGIGYFAGGLFSKTQLQKELLLMRLLYFAGLSLLLGLLIIKTVSVVSFIESLFVGCVFLLMLLLPSFLFGSIVSVSIQCLNSLAQGEKKASVDVFAFSSAGGVLFAFIVGFYLIPIKGLVFPTSLSVAIIFFLLVFLNLRLKKNKFRRWIVFYLVLFLVTAFGVHSVSPTGIDVLHYSEGLNGQIIVVDVPSTIDSSNSDRILFINRMGQTWINKSSGESQWSYVNYVTSMASLYPPGSRSLVLGLGGGVVACQLSKFANHFIDVAEIDQQIIDVAVEYFDLNSTPNIKVFCEDARRYVKKSNIKYDFILVDIFNGEIVPSHGLSIEAFQDLKNILSPNGIVVVNFNGFERGSVAISGKVLGNTMCAAGFNLKILPTSEPTESERNNLYIGYIKQPDWDNRRLALNVHNRPLKIDSAMHDFQKGQFLIVSDDLPLMEYINADAAGQWRKSYFEKWTKRLQKVYGLDFFK